MWRPDETYSWRDVAVSTLLLGLVGFLVSRCFKRVPRTSGARQNASGGHRWCHTSAFSQPSYCNMCGTLLMTSHGAFCEWCGVCCCVGCKRAAESHMPCKLISCPADATLRHHWVKGNLPLGSVCEVCEGGCGDTPGLDDYRCCMCQRTVHSRCRQNIAEMCDLGEFGDFIVPPTCVRVRGCRTGRRLCVTSICPPPPPSSGNTKDDDHGRSCSNSSDANECGHNTCWSPLVVLGNPRSGNNEGERVLTMFRRYLNPAQVVDLSEQSAESALRCFCGTRCRVLVAGGDGTIDWVLNSVEKLVMRPTPAVAPLPLGTGNDLWRVLDTQSSTGTSVVTVDENDDYAADTMRRLRSASTVAVDRWMVRLDPVRGVQLPGSTVLMTNYVSWGVDALVTLNFHQTRESPVYLWSSRLFNKLIYLCYGTKDVLQRECIGLQRHLSVTMDGRRVALPDIEAVVVQNIASWGAGVRAWQLGSGGAEFGEQRMDDGLLEVFCVYSSFHIAQMQVGMSEPLRLGQARAVKIELRAKVPMQLDGEPWEQGPCTVTITHHGQASLLAMGSG